MLLDKKETTELTEKQKIFLSALFGEANGEPRAAAEIAGYAPTSYPKVVQGLKDQILERAETILAAHSPKAALSIANAIDDDGSIPGASIRMEAAKQILDRVGLVKREKIDINAKIAHGIFILPAKEA
jgi:hypothetical protein|tara:strand:+ start:1804 stop:2187 length:384 start_codon:yes stop_codon:yes gene_type:complete